MLTAMRARLVAVVVGWLLALLISAGVAQTPELSAVLQEWVSRTFDLLMFLGYAVVHPLIQRYINPTGAFSSTAAAELETMVGVRDLDGRKAIAR